MSGVKHNMKNPGTIANIVHHDPSGADRGMDGMPTDIDLIMSALTQPAADGTVLAVTNMSSTVFHYLWVGDVADDPGILDATNSIAIPPLSSKPFYVGHSPRKDQEGNKLIKIDSLELQVVLFKNY